MKSFFYHLCLKISTANAKSQKTYISPHFGFFLAFSINVLQRAVRWVPLCLAKKAQIHVFILLPDAKISSFGYWPNSDDHEHVSRCFEVPNRPRSKALFIRHPAIAANPNTFFSSKISKKIHQNASPQTANFIVLCCPITKSKLFALFPHILATFF